MKRLRLLYWVVALALCAFHLFFLMAYAVFCKSTGNPIHTQAVGLGVLNGVAMVLICTSIVVQRSKFQPWLQLVGAISVTALVVSLVWYLRDAPPIDNDYAEKYLQVARSGGYRYLAPFFSENKVEILKNELADIAARETRSGNTHQVLSAWERISEYRTAIEQLDRFQTIRDIPENTPIQFNMPLLQYPLLNSVAEVYADYIRYEIANGNISEAIQQLVQLHRLARKGMAGSALLIHKMIFSALAHKTMIIAFGIVDDENCGQDSLRILKEGFKPITPLESDMTRVFISEYLMYKNMFKKIGPSNWLTMARFESQIEDPNLMIRSYVQRPLFYLLFKPQMTITAIHEYYNCLIEGETHQPPDYSKAREYMKAYTSKPSPQNVVGWYLNTLGWSDFSKYGQKVRSKIIISDLLACAISKHLNEPIIIKDYFTNGPLRYKEKRCWITSPGPDGKYGTEDDITLKTPECDYGEKCKN